MLRRTFIILMNDAYCAQLRILSKKECYANHIYRRRNLLQSITTHQNHIEEFDQ